jgi:hypothetical protein
MSKSSNHSNSYKEYSAEDIRKYLSGQMNAADMNALEKAALDDPFLADAIEGYQNAKEEHADELISTHLDALKKQLSNKTHTGTQAPVRSFRWQWAAAAVLLIVGTIVVYTNVNRSDAPGNTIAINETDSKIQRAESLKKDIADSVTTGDTDLAKSNPANKDTEALKNKSTVSSEKELNRPAPSNGLTSRSQDPNIVTAPAAPKAEAVERKDSSILSGADDKDIAVSKTAAEEKNTKEAEQLEKKADELVVVADPSKKQSKSKSPAAVNNPGLNYFSGKVVDTNNRPIANATVQLANTRNGYVTDQYGNFRFSSTDTAVNVNVSVLGYGTQSFRLNNSTPINQLQLQPSNSALSEVVITKPADTRKKESARYKTNYPKVMVQDAEPVNGWIEFEKYIEANKKTISGADNRQGEVVVSFSVNRQSELTSFKIEQSLSPAHDAEAIRLVKEGPPWRLIKGKKAKITVIIRF